MRVSRLRVEAPASAGKAAMQVDNTALRYAAGSVGWCHHYFFHQLYPLGPDDGCYQAPKPYAVGSGGSGIKNERAKVHVSRFRGEGGGLRLGLKG